MSTDYQSLLDNSYDYYAATFGSWGTSNLRNFLDEKYH